MATIIEKVVGGSDGKIDSSTVKDLKGQIDAFTSDPTGNAPGVVFCAVNKKGEPIFEHASGKVGAGQEAPMTLDTVLWIASCTKMITGIACMQLCEQGKLSLDDSSVVEKLAPELRDVKVIEDGKLVPKNKGITLRMLLSHTAGFGYSFFDKRLNNYYGAAGVEEFSGYWYDTISQPLVNQPGSVWEYGVNIDWAGVLVERATHMSLNDYFQEHIFKPMGLTHINMFPTEEMKKELAFMNTRNAEGQVVPRPAGHLNQRPLHNLSPEEKKTVFNAGGAGCFARPSQYCQIIAMLLNNGTHAPTGAQILKPETIETMFTNQIPEFPNYARQGIDPPKLDYSNPLPALYPDPPEVPQGWGLTFFLHVEPSAIHSKGTAWWAGLANLFWWADREKGIGGMIGSQILPFGDAKILGLWAQIEQGLYTNLK